MNESPPDSWFYSNEGERIGPVTFADLQIKSQEGTLNPRLDLVWKYGMDQWTAAGEIEGLFERREAEKKEELAPPTDHYTPPKEESVEEKMSREGNWPGARRRGFLAALIVFPILWTLGFQFATPLLDAQFGWQVMSYLNVGALALPFLVVLIVSVKRFANLGMSGWWALGFLVPLLNLWVGFRCVACPAGYGYHQKLDGLGVFLAILYCLCALVVVSAIAAGIALLFGTIGTPEMKDQLLQAIRETTVRLPQR